MNREETKEGVEIMQHYVDGGNIEIRGKGMEMTSNERIIRSLRNIQWELAKGHLFALLQTYRDDDYERFAILSRAILRLIADVEIDGLQG